MSAFKKAVRESLPTVTVISGGTGSGKSYSCLSLAKGLAGGKRFAVCDSERGRAKHYSDYFDFDHADISPPFRPEKYLDLIQEADKAGYPVIVIDQFSSEWSGEGGVLDWQEDELDRMAGDNWQKREACKFAAWIKPKMAHKALVQKLLQINAHLVIALRAEEKIEIVKEGGKTKIVPKQSLVGLHGWIPICEKNLPFEATVSFLLTADAPGIPKPIKLQEQHKSFFPLDRPMSAESGRLLAEWASGGVKPADKPATKKPAPPPSPAEVQAAVEPMSLDAFKFVLDTCDSVDELKKAWADNEARIPQDSVSDAKAAYVETLKKIKAANPPAAQPTTTE